MKKENKFLTVLANLDIALACVVLALLVIMTVLGVAWRYILGHPFTWLEEVQLACMVWIVFAAGGAAFRTGNHVAIEMIVDMFPKKLQKIMDYLIGVVVVLVVGYLFVQSLGYIQIFLKSGRSTPMLDIPYAVIYGIAPLSFIDMLISYFYSVVKGVKSEAKEAAEQ
jgi:TRAP-type C4-dicarboxylate transport system permease small subunit